jgi:subtilisin family serine protease
MNHRRFSRRQSVYTLVLILSWPSVPVAGGQTAATNLPDRTLAGQAAKLIEKAHREGPQRVIVGLGSDFDHDGKLKATQRAAQRSVISGRQSALMSRLGGQNVVERRRFQFIPFMVVQADARALEHMAALPTVSSLEEDRLEAPSMASSNAIIGSAAAWDLGYDGSDWTVAVLDTGVDKTHPFFATLSKVVSEACYSSTDSTEKATTVCPGGLEVSTATGSGVNCPGEMDGCDHGTHVAGSAAGDDQAGPNFGVARGADIIAIQVFTRVDSAPSCGGSIYTPCALSFKSDQIAALERVYALRTDFNIAAVNMSLGGTRYSDEEECDLQESSRKAAIDNLLSAGIATIAASGNADKRDSMAAPACISSAISVAATTDADQIAAYSNVTDFLDLLAPGSSITSSVPGDGVETWNGTSMAAPHVAGAWAVLKQKEPDKDVATVLKALRDTSTRLDDDRSGGKVKDMRRINLDQAVIILGQPVPEIETSPVAGSLFDFGSIAAGRATDSLLLHVQNSGDADLSLACALSGTDAEAFEIELCPNAVGPGSAVEVRFYCQPQIVGEFSASLDLTSNDADEAEVDFALLCKGTDSLFVDGFEVTLNK